MNLLSSHDSECTYSGSGHIVKYSMVEHGGPEPRWQAVGSWTDEQEALSEPLNSSCVSSC